MCEKNCKNPALRKTLYLRKQKKNDSYYDTKNFKPATSLRSASFAIIISYPCELILLYIPLNKLKKYCFLNDQIQVCIFI